MGPHLYCYHMAYSLHRIRTRSGTMTRTGRIRNNLSWSRSLYASGVNISGADGHSSHLSFPLLFLGIQLLTHIIYSMKIKMQIYIVFLIYMTHIRHIEQDKVRIAMFNTLQINRLS